MGNFDIFHSCNDNFHPFLFRKHAGRNNIEGDPQGNAEFRYRRRLTMTATRYLPFLGRVLIGLPFAMSGMSKLGAYGATTAMIGAVGLPFPPLAFAIAVVVELGGGLLLIAGYRTRLIAATLAVFALATAVSFHSNFADQNQMIHFLKNVMMAGGLLQIAAFGAGALSLDNRRNKNELGSNLAVA
jgi:putative oxidoreductase